MSRPTIGNWNGIIFYENIPDKNCPICQGKGLAEKSKYELFKDAFIAYLNFRNFRLNKEKMCSCVEIKPKTSRCTLDIVDYDGTVVRVSDTKTVY